MYLCITFIKLLYNLGLIIPYHTDDDDNKDDEVDLWHMLYGNDTTESNHGMMMRH